MRDPNYGYGTLAHRYERTLFNLVVFIVSVASLDGATSIR